MVTLPTTPADLIMLSTELRERGWVRERERERGREGGSKGSPVYFPVGVGALQLPWMCAISLCLSQELLRECTPQE